MSGIAELLAELGAPVAPAELENPGAEGPMLAELLAIAEVERVRGIVADWHAAVPHLDAVRRGAIHVNDERVPGRFAVLTPDRDVIGRWIMVRDFATFELAEAFAAGYCHRRDHA